MIYVVFIVFAVIVIFKTLISQTTQSGAAVLMEMA